MQLTSKNFIFGILVAIFIVTTIIFGVFWVRAEREVRIKNQELGDLQKQLQELQTKLTEQKPQTPPETQQMLDLSTWKTYRNEDFEFNYPSAWYIQEGGDLGVGYVGVTPKITEVDFNTIFFEPIFIITNVSFVHEGYPVKQSDVGAKEIAAGFKQGLASAKQNLIFIDGRRAVEISGTGNYELIDNSFGKNVIGIFLFSNGSVYEFHVKGKEFFNTFETILSTFKFITSTSSGQAN